MKIDFSDLKEVINEIEEKYQKKSYVVLINTDGKILVDKMTKEEIISFKNMKVYNKFAIMDNADTSINSINNLSIKGDLIKNFDEDFDENKLT